MTQHIPNWEHPDNIRNITFVNCLKFVEETVELIQRTEKVAQIICLYHGGIERDLVTHQPNETLSGENQGYEICQRVKGLDILVTGHQHQSVITRINDILVTQTAHDAQEIAVIEVHDGRISAYLKPVPDTVDQNLLALVADEEQQTQTWLDVPLGHLISGDLLISDMFEARLHKHPLVSFLNQVQMASTNTDISLVGLANSVVGFRHEISMRDIIASYVYPNTLTVLEITGKTLKKALERSAEYFALQNGRISINPKFTAPKPKHYNYDMFDGIEYTIKVSNPIGQRIVSLTYHQEPIAEDRLYRVAMNNYRSVGGDDFFMYKSGTIIHDTQKHIVDCIADYIIEHHEITVDHQDNIHVII
ncbi:Trifunctional nucleotide phosphoesterase protein YfkN [bioreactor metagenome]|uniref:Trifunctional nucleotide phosphoesterase protein YfkN n=1 Tax=bioreactor metagenome TaxID=1076179 RepID=A0A645D204_9ZZZZ